MRNGPFSFAACCGAAGTPLAADHPDRLADLEERVLVLKEALRELLFFHDLEEAGHRLPGMGARWEGAWRIARDALNEDGAAS